MSLLIFGCENKKYSKIEKLNKDNKYIYSKICYIFLNYNYIIPCKKFNSDDFYEGLNEENLESGFIYNPESIPHFQYLSLKFSSDTFLLNELDGRIDTLYIVPAFVEYCLVPNFQKEKLHEFKFEYNEKLISLNGYTEFCLILNIIPFRPYKISDECIIKEDSLAIIYYAKAPISEGRLKKGCN